MSAITLYDASVPIVQNSIAALSAILKKAESAPNAASMVDARIHPDMLPLSFQVHFATDLAQKMLARLTGNEPAKLENDFKTFADFQARVDETQALLAKADKDVINKRAGETVPLGLGPGKTVNILGTNYVDAYSLPNIFFHVTTAYNILRKEGVPLGKLDFLTPYLGKHVPN